MDWRIVLGSFAVTTALLQAVRLLWGRRAWLAVSLFVAVASGLLLLWAGTARAETESEADVFRATPSGGAASIEAGPVSHWPCRGSSGTP